MTLGSIHSSRVHACFFFEQTVTRGLLCARPCVSHQGHEARGTDGQEGSLPAGSGPQLPAPVSPPMTSPDALIHAAGCRVRIPAEVLILNSIVLPHKELSRSFTNQIIL